MVLNCSKKRLPLNRDSGKNGKITMGKRGMLDAPHWEGASSKRERESRKRREGSSFFSRRISRFLRLYEHRPQRERFRYPKSINELVLLFTHWLFWNFAKSMPSRDSLQASCLHFISSAKWQAP
jgi:hypothetical protein